MYDTAGGYVTVYDGVSKIEVVPATTVELKECPAYVPYS